MAKRKIIKIDEDKCNGCGACVPNCAEGALQIIAGKARLVSEVFCDGLGACIGHCPQGAITTEEREAEVFNEAKAMAHKHETGGCPGSRVMDLREHRKQSTEHREKRSSRLGQWPVQIMLVPEEAPYFRDAKLLIAADCVPFACADFHEEFLKGKILLVGCPKLDDALLYKEKITRILKNNEIRSLTCVHMEVPCCFGLMGIVKGSLADSGKKIPLEEINIGIRGAVLR